MPVPLPCQRIVEGETRVCYSPMMGSSPWWLPWAVYAPMGAVGFAWARIARGAVLTTPKNAWLSQDSSVALSMGCALALLVVVITVWSTRVLVARTQWARALHRELRITLVGSSAGQLAVLASLSAFAEELFFRAALQPVVGLVAASCAFGLVHVSPRGTGVAWTAWALLMGLVFGVLFEASGSLIVPIVAHALINYENMQYICNYDPTYLDNHVLHTHRHLHETRAPSARDA